MMFKSRVLLSFLVFGLISGCASQAPVEQTASTPASIADGQSNTTGSQTPSPDSGGPIVLTLWLPPEFDTAGGNLSANLLQNRLVEFTDQHPQVRVETRVKAEDGTGGLLDSLLAAQTAAPLAQPDLVLLPHIQLPEAVQSGVLYPLSGPAAETDSHDWYPFARQMVNIDGQSYGIPFSADALAVAFRPTAISDVPPNWSALLEARRPLGLAAADPWAQFSIAELSALKLKAGTSINFSYSQDELVHLFEFYSNAQARSVFPFWLSQYQTYEQSWQAFTEGRVPMVVAWTSKILDTRNVDISGAPLPIESGDPFTLVKGWVWAISTPYPERVELISELAQFLTTPEFIAQWSAAAGMLPPRASSLAAWSPDARQALASQIITTAVALPPRETLDLWGQPLADAMVGVLKQELTPQEAMEAVLSAVSNSQ